MSELLGCGSDMLFPKEEPLLCRRPCFRLRAASKQRTTIDMRIPNSIPGKNPARTASGGNLSQEATGRGEVVFSDGTIEIVGVVVGFAVVLGLVPVLEGLVVAVEDCTELMDDVAGGSD